MKMIRRFTDQWTENWQKYSCYGFRELLEKARGLGINATSAWGESELICEILKAIGVPQYKEV